MISLEEFIALPVDQVAELVRGAGPKSAVFPINGTRRWFALEHPEAMRAEDSLGAYMDISQKRHVELYRLFFDHGVDTLLTPIFGSELFRRGDDYVRRMVMDGLVRLAEHPDFLRFYDEYNVRVRFYGDYRRELTGTVFSPLIEKFDSLTHRTRDHKRARLFFGVFASDLTETCAALAVDFHKQHSRVPTRSEMVEMVYGEYVDPVDFFIGFDKLSAFDYPLLASGEEDLYFTVAPSLYLGQKQLREILFDHLFTRRSNEPEYEELTREDWGWMRSFYAENKTRTVGLGTLRSNIWYMGPGAKWPGDQEK
jgi:tuberculosinol/isotuberculosinol synthase